MTNESRIEGQLIQWLEDLKYTYRPDIRDRGSLEENFRTKFNAHNRVTLTNSEFKRLNEEIIDPDVFESANRLRKRNTFKREDGTPLHYTLVDINKWCRNEYEVINQLRINTDSSYHRYDVILLINGIPVVQIELKTLEVNPRRAIQQIVDYKNDPGNGYTNSLLCFMQLFIVSNQSKTIYFANNDNQHFQFNADEQFLPVYEFADVDNHKINDLKKFTDRFLPKCTLGEMISKYMVLVATEQKILVMRPYQIYAVKAIVDCIHQNRGNGYIWHTTGSGKTLTSFKASTLLKDNPDIEKCLFVVDRKDLDRQTRQEFNKFQEGSVEENTNTESLVQRLLSTDYADKVIVTTIQKLGLALDEDGNRFQRNPKKGSPTFKQRLAPLKDKRVVFIFDECHRSQFGENHKAIKEFFPNAQLFGFTGTPIFPDNASYMVREGKEGSYKTTKDVFQKELHAYTITHAINDRNVLKFHIDYLKKDRGGKDITFIHKAAVVKAILDKHDKATHYGRFNAIFATASINDAIAYYQLFIDLQIDQANHDEQYRPLNIACVFSPPAEGNKDIQQIQEDLPQEKTDNQDKPNEKKAALGSIVSDYNHRYGTNFSISDFDGYYQDIQQRVKDQKYPNSDLPHSKKIDIVIVVDMLLTGFDSKYLNTLYVDKNLRYHGLIQAFSRTNRVLNDTKPYGNILDFRLQENAVNQAIALFSGEKGDKQKEIWLVDPAPQVIAQYEKAVEKLQQFMEDQDLACAPADVSNLKGDQARAGFVNCFKEVQRFKTQLNQYTDLDKTQQDSMEGLLSEDALRSFKGAYLETAKRLKAQQDKNEDVPPEIQELDFEFVLFSSAVIDYDYIMGLIARYTQDSPPKEKMTKAQLINLLSSSANMMEERDDIRDFINQLDFDQGRTENEIRTGYQDFKAKKSERALFSIADQHGLEANSLKAFVDTIMERMIFDGEHLSDLLAPLELGWKDRTRKELALMEDLVPLLLKRAQGRDIAGLGAYDE